ncbi:MAG TPA: M15 family metallopeptidase [Pyrinomonadaceae bacterium]|nr:M15 family metallopeptidase [Pyrinomonadaceae bacterium]
MTTVSEFALSSTCSTAGLRPLNDQILALLLPVVSAELVRCDDILRPSGNSTIALLQPAAKESLRHAIDARGRQMELVHGYRTVAQQMVLREWFLHGQRCGIKSARAPGRSDHEKGTAIDINDFAGWKPFLTNRGWQWAGMGDRAHFHFVGGGTTDRILRESIRAFQRLWNQHNPQDRIAEDGVYGEGETGPRLRRSPIEGF